MFVDAQGLELLFPYLIVCFANFRCFWVTVDLHKAVGAFVRFSLGVRALRYVHLKLFVLSCSLLQEKPQLF